MSGIDPRMKVLSDFSDAQRAIPQLEDNVEAAFARVATQASPKLVPTNKKTSAYTAELDDLVVAAGTFNITMPVASAQNAGRRIAIEVQSGTVTVVPTTGQVQGAASDALSTVGRYDYESDGVGWWRAPLGAGGAAVSPATTVTSETTFGIVPAVGVGVLYARNDHTHGSPATPVTSIAADDGTLVFSTPTGAVTAHVGVITDANVDSTILTESVFDAGVKKLRLELQHIRLLVGQLVELEMTA